MALGATPPQPSALQAIKNAAKANNVDWRAMASIAQHESGLNPANVGDNGTSFGLFQLHQGGALPRGTDPALAKTAAWNANFAARQIKGLGIGGKMPVEEQIRQIAARFERPADVAGEQQAALGYYKTRYAGLPAMQAAAPASLGSAPTGATAPTTLQSALPTLQAGLGLAQASSQRALDSLGKISGRSMQAAQAPDLSLLMNNASGSTSGQQGAPAPKTVTVPLNGKTPHAAEADPQVAKVIALAKHFLGTAYQWGGESPKTGFDCSGLLQYVWGQNGVKIPRVAADQFKAGTPVSAKDLQPGDAVFFRNSEGIHHVGMFIGGGKFIQSPHTGDVVKISSLSEPGYAKEFAGGRRY